MPISSPASRPWRMFRRVFLWTLAAFALLWSLRADAGSTDDLQLPRLSTVAIADDPILPPLPETTTPVAATAAEPTPVQPVPATDLPGASVTHFPEANWSVTILPRPVNASESMRRRYEDAYAAIPYRKTEYYANPGYRHEATLELMFGQLRPKTVVSQYDPKTLAAPAFTLYKPFLHSRSDIYRWNSSLAPFSFGFPLTPYYPAYPRYPVYY